MAVQAFLKFVDRKGMDRVGVRPDAPSKTAQLAALFSQAREAEWDGRRANWLTAATAATACIIALPLYKIGAPLWGKVLIRGAAAAWQAVWGAVAATAGREAHRGAPPPLRAQVEKIVGLHAQITQGLIHRVSLEVAAYPRAVMWIQADPATDYNGAFHCRRIVERICHLAQDQHLALVHRQVSSRAQFRAVARELATSGKECALLILTGHGSMRGIHLQTTPSGAVYLEPQDFAPLGSLRTDRAHPPDLFLYSCSTAAIPAGGGHSFAQQVWWQVGTCLNVVALTRPSALFELDETGYVKRGLADLTYLPAAPPSAPSIGERMPSLCTRIRQTFARLCGGRTRVA